MVRYTGLQRMPPETALLFGRFSEGVEKWTAVGLLVALAIAVLVFLFILALI